jgi:hypothetical protein
LERNRARARPEPGSAEAARLSRKAGIRDHELAPGAGESKPSPAGVRPHRHVRLDPVEEPLDVKLPLAGHTPR